MRTYRVNTNTLINRLAKENSRLSHENVKLQKEIRNLNRSNKRLMRIIKKLREKEFFKEVPIIMIREKSDFSK